MTKLAKIIMINFINIGVLFYGVTALAFPDMIRHGYARCNTCHVAPSGGGALTPYGRALAKETMSTWGYEGEQEWHYGALKEGQVPEWLRVGGDYRALQSHYKDQNMALGRFIEMQQQVELAVQTDKYTASVQFGADTLVDKSKWYLPGYYVAANLLEKLNLRVGRFLPRFGIKMPDHILSTRGSVNYGIQAERHVAEVIYTEDKYDVSFAVSQGEFKDETSAEALYSQFNYIFGEKLQLGLSFEKYFKADKRMSFGLSTMWGISEHMYLLTDNIFQQRDIGGLTQNGFYHFVKLGYEIEKGIHVFLIEDLQKQNLSADNFTQGFYGLGFTFFPRPHLEIQGVWAKRYVEATDVRNADYAWLLLHYYL